MAVAVLGDIARAQPFGGVEVHLQGAALPVAADGVAQHEFQLGAVEGAFAGIEGVVQAGGVGGFRQRLFGLVPHRIAADAVFGPGRQLHPHLFEAQVLVAGQQQLAERRGLRRDLLMGAEDMGVVLHKAAHPHDAVQRARRLIAVAGAELRHADRQFAIGFQALR